MSAKTIPGIENMGRMYATAYYARDAWKRQARTSEAQFGASLIRQRRTYDDRAPYGSIEREAESKANGWSWTDSRGRQMSCNGLSRADGSTFARTQLPEDAPSWPIYVAAVRAGDPLPKPIYRTR